MSTKTDPVTRQELEALRRLAAARREHSFGSYLKRLINEWSPSEEAEDNSALAD